jgi:hypothetical protein
MEKLQDRFPEKHKQILVYLKSGETFIGSFHSGASGIGSISGDYTDHYYEDGNYEDIEGWEYLSER